jgi:hypothetical protein
LRTRPLLVPQPRDQGVEGLDPLALEISIIDGKALPVIEEPG